MIDDNDELEFDPNEILAENILLKRRIASLVDELDAQMQSRILLESKDFSYTSVLGALPINIYQKDLDGRYIFIHESYTNKDRILREDWIGKTDFDLVPEELARKYDRDDQYVLSNEETLDMVESYLRADGSTGFLHVIKSPLRNESGSVIGTQGIFRDITFQHNAERLLFQQKEQLEQVVQVSCHVHYHLEFAYNRQQMQETWFLQLAPITGIKDAAALAQAGGWQALVHPQDVPVLEERMALLEEDGHLITHFSILQPGKTERVVRDVALRVRRPGGKSYLVGAATNLSDPKLRMLHRQ
jgi:PAS domain S-box-containing protein